MAIGDLAAIDVVIYSTLYNDPALKALCPDGVYWDVAPGARAFVLLTRSDGEAVNALGGGDGWLKVTYTATAVIGSSSVVAANDAAYRIHELLHHQLAEVAAGNYSIMHVERTIPIRYTEVDSQNTAARWQHHGGEYTVMVCPTNLEGGE